MVTLFCLIDGETLANDFPIEIPPSRTIGHLKNIVQDKRKSTFKDVDPSTLVVYQVSVPGDDPNALEGALARIEWGEIETLKSVDLVRKVFANRIEGLIQIMVRCKRV